MMPGRPSSTNRLPAVIIIVIIVALGGGFALYNHNKAANKPGGTTSTANTKSSKLIIKDFGIEITLPKNLIGTKVETAKRPASGNFTVPPTVNLILDQYSRMVTNCLGSKFNFSSPYASLSKISGQPRPDDALLLKQFSDFYIERNGSGLQLKCTDQNLQAAFGAQTTAYNQSLKDAFLSAQLTK